MIGGPVETTVATAATPEVDARKTAVLNALRQLSTAQINRVLSYRGEMIHDTFNYKDGAYCPLAVACGLPGIVKEPTNEKVIAILHVMGYTVMNTRGVPGTFYRDNRAADLKTAAMEVLEERKMVKA